MNKFYRILSAILVFAMCFSLAPVSALALDLPDLGVLEDVVEAVDAVETTETEDTAEAEDVLVAEDSTEIEVEEELAVTREPSESDASTAEESIVVDDVEAETLNALSSSASAAEVTAAMDSIKNNFYPAGSYWTSSFGGGYQCYAFGRWVANQVFGSYPWNCIAYSNGYTDGNGWKLIVGPASTTAVEPGDVIEVRPTNGLKDHTAIV